VEAAESISGGDEDSTDTRPGFVNAAPTLWGQFRATVIQGDFLTIAYARDFGYFQGFKGKIPFA
jgi:hypothetical protein